MKLALLYALPALAAPSAVVLELDRILARGDESRAQCEAFRKETENLPVFNYDHPVHASKGEALRALALAEKRPNVVSKADQEFFWNHADELSAEIGENALAEKHTQLPIPCLALRLDLNHLATLLSDAKKYSFSPDENKRARAAVGNYVRPELPFPSLLSALVHGAVLKRVVSVNAPAARRAEAEKKVQDFSDFGDKTRSEVTNYFRKIDPARHPLAGIRFEHEKVQELSAKYEALLKELDPYVP